MVSIHWFDSSMDCLDSICWSDSLIRFIDSISWFDSLIQVIYSIPWFDSSFRLIVSINWIGLLIRFIHSILDSIQCLESLIGHPVSRHHVSYARQGNSPLATALQVAFLVFRCVSFISSVFEKKYDTDICIVHVVLIVPVQNLCHLSSFSVQMALCRQALS